MAEETERDEETRDAMLEGRWQEFEGRVREAWGVLTDDDLDEAQGSWQRVVGRIRERTGDAIDDVETRLNEILDRIEEAGSPEGEGRDDES